MPKGEKLDGDVLKRRRLAARRLLDGGVAQAEVARKVHASRQAVSRWALQPKSELEMVKPQGRKSWLDEPRRARLRTVLAAGPKAWGFSGGSWTIFHMQWLIDNLFGRRFSKAQAWRLLRQLESKR